MAARDRFGGFVQACDPQNFEPNLALNLEIADLINAKKGNAPREAAIAIVHYINNRNPNVSMLALNLLDICVKNCGYPFHLQISTKEFLNELVRRFPERPPVHASRPQMKILELIEEWRQTICQTSRYKDDLGFIRDMHRLLSYKGYMFPQINQQDAAVLNPSDNLRSAEEMEEEEREAQAAKLQELIRRGGPQDLQEANKLMKVMAGYDTRNKTDWRAKAAEEVGKIQQKAKLLEEMLQSYKPGDAFKDGDVSEELANALASAQPKIRKMCEEDSEDHEAVAKLLEINDSLHRTLERYKLIKKGDIEGASKIPKGTLGTSGAGVSRGPDNELSLIDLGGPDDEPTAATASNGTATAGAAAPRANLLEDDLLGLSLGGEPFGQTGGISLGGLSSIPTISHPAPPPSQPQPSQASYDLFGTISSSEPPAPVSSPPAASFSPSPAIQQQLQGSKPSDPFAALSGSTPDPFSSLKAPTPRQSSPFQFQQSIATPPPSSQSAPPAAAAAATTSSGGDDEWTFASALPDQSSEITVTNSSINVLFNLSRQPPDDHILISSRISNNAAQPVSELTFQVAVTRGLTLRLERQSSRDLAPHQVNGITQTMRLHGVEKGRGSSVKMRWKCTYLLGGQRREESGEIGGLGIE